MNDLDLHYIADERGALTAVVVPIAVWREISAELETEHLRRSPAMRDRLLDALHRDGGASLPDVMNHLGVSADDLDLDPA